MIFDSRTHDRLMEQFPGMSRESQLILILCAVMYEPITEFSIFHIVRKLPNVFPGIKSHTEMPAIIRSLLKLKLLDLDLRCSPEIVETVIRIGAGGQVMSLADFMEMTQTILAEFPRAAPHRVRDESDHFLCLMRDFRIALHTGNAETCLSLYPLVQSECAVHSNSEDPFLMVCCTPFDPDWFDRLAFDIRLKTVLAGLRAGVHFLETFPGLFDYAKRSDFIQSIPESERASYDSLLLSRMLIAGNVTDAKRYLEDPNGFLFAPFFYGWIAFLEGKPDAAARYYETGLNTFLTEGGKTDFLTNSVGGIFYILTHLIRIDTPTFAHLTNIVETGISGKHLTPMMTSVFGAIDALIHVQQYDYGHVQHVLSKNQETGYNIDILLWSLAEYLVTGSLEEPRMAHLLDLFNRSHPAGMGWIAIECADLLNRIQGPQPNYSQAIDGFHARTGLSPVLFRLLAEENWKKRLSALTHVLESGNRLAPPVGTLRLIWTVRMAGDTITLIPKEQKCLAPGQWTTGKIVTPGRLITERPEYLTSHDLRLCACIRSIRRPFKKSGHDFDMDMALPALIGHPLLFLDENPPVRIIMVEGEPEAVVQATDDTITIKIQPVIQNGRVKIIQDAPTRFRVVKMTDEQARLSRIVSQNGLTIPASARTEVMSAITRMSLYMTVHSNLHGQADMLEELSSDSRPCIRISPFGAGFRIDLSVKPFTTEGPYVKPGIGPDILMREKEGKRIHITRNLKEELAEAHQVIDEIDLLKNANSKNFQWVLKDPHECLLLLTGLQPFLTGNAILVEWPEGHKISITREVSSSDCRLSIVSGQKWFELVGHVQISDHQILDIRSLIDTLSTAVDKRFIPMGEGQYLALTRELRDLLISLADVAEGEGPALRLNSLAALALGERLNGLARLRTDDPWNARMEVIRKGKELTPDLPEGLTANLRDYQIDGYHWLSRMAFWGVGACLADDMGLGKTLQVLTLLLSRSKKGPALVIAPASVCMGWLEEAVRFTPSLNVLLLSAKNRGQTVENLTAGDVLVVSYNLMNLETRLLTRIQWQTIVLDEAQIIKNITAKRTRSAMKLTGDFKILTTGTPIENHLGELYTLFNFLNPELLGSASGFRNQFTLSSHSAINPEHIRRLKALIQPFILRRTKSQVLSELPEKTELLLTIDLSEKESAFYEALRQQALVRIEQSRISGGLNHFQVLAEITRLRLACCDTRLVAPESGIASAKLKVLDNLVDDLLENHHRVLIFSQFVGYLAKIRKLLKKKNVSFRYLDGQLTMPERKKEIDSFQRGEADIFLISLKAGGLGLNLTAADYVILMDPWWNPAVEDQAADRAHRIGQTMPVTIYRMIASHTIEEKIVQLHKNKRELAESLLEGSDVSGRVSADELLRMIQEA